MQMQKLGGPIGMVQTQIEGQMGMGDMGNPMGSQLQNQLSGPSMQGQMMPSPGMGGPVPMGGMVGESPSPSAPPHMLHHVPPQRNLGMGTVTSPTSSLNTPGGVIVGSPGGEEVAYREKVRQLSKYIEPLRRVMQRMFSEGVNVEKLPKMNNLLDILSNPNKRMPLETLMKYEVVLEKFQGRKWGLRLPAITTGKEQMFNPLLEVVKLCLSFPLCNHTLKRTFGSTLEALNGPDIKNLPPPQKMPKFEEPEKEIPDVLQGEIAILDSRCKVSLDTLQLPGGGGISLVAALDDAYLPCVPPVHLYVPRGYPAAAHTRRAPRAPPASPFLEKIERAMDARCARLPKSFSVGQLLDAWEMSVRAHDHSIHARPSARTLNIPPLRL